MGSASVTHLIPILTHELTHVLPTSCLLSTAVQGISRRVGVWLVVKTNPSHAQKRKSMEVLSVKKKEEKKFSAHV